MTLIPPKGPTSRTDFHLKEIECGRLAHSQAVLSAASNALTVCLLLACFWPFAGAAQMVNPDIDNQPGPFSYFSKPTDELSIMGASSGVELTPEGFLYTGFGELMFFVGPEQAPISARIRTLEDGYLPVISYTVENSGITYCFRLFAGTAAAGAAVAPVVNFVRVTVSNTGKVERAAFVATAVRYQGEQTTDRPTGDNRFTRPIPAGGIGQFYQPGESFSKSWIYGVNGNMFLRDQRVLYYFPLQPEPRLTYTLRTHYNRVRPLVPTALDLSPTTPADAAAYTIRLGPGESRTLDFKMPLVPVTPASPESAAIEKADFDTAHQQTVAAWRRIVAQGMSIELSEKKVTDTFNASLVYCLMALNKVDGQWVQTVNQFQYHRFYLRDAADFVRMYDATGYSDIASKVLDFFPARQQNDGNFLSQAGQYDGWGEAMWAFGEHFRRTGDLAFAQSVFPLMVRAVDWLEKALAADPLHIMPVSDVKDNEYVAAHLTGYNFLALDGLKSAIEIAKETGHEQEARRFQSIYDSYRACFLKLLDRAAADDNGYIPPSLDGGAWKGTDWGNLLSVTPEAVVDPHDRRVTATLQRAQSQYQEGISTYKEPDDGQYLHHYLTIKNTLTELVRGQQEQALREFYAELLHTSSTHAGFEYAIRPWGTRDFEGNLAPHGWFAADYRNLLRNMIVREEEGDLHLFSAISPEWVGAGKAIRVNRAPTYFGAIDLSLEMPSESKAVLHLRSSFRRAPSRILLHLPWFMQVDWVTANGVKLPLSGSIVTVPPNARELHIEWKRSPKLTTMSYERTVKSYKAEYRKRYEHFVNTGELSSGEDPWRVPED